MSWPPSLSPTKHQPLTPLGARQPASNDITHTHAGTYVLSMRQKTRGQENAVSRTNAKRLCILFVRKNGRVRRRLEDGPHGPHRGIRLVSNRGENGRKRSVNTKIIFVFIFFLGNETRNGNSGNENDIGNSETLETKVRYENYTGYDRNLKFDR
jgi:hypothetical protein